MNARLLFPIVVLALAFAGGGCNKSGKLNNASLPTPAAGPVELRVKWTPGEQMVQEFNLDQTMQMNLPGQSAPTKQHMTMGQKFSLTVVNAGADGSHEVEMKFLSARAALETGETKMNYDSGKDSAAGEKNVLAKGFAKLIGCKVQYFLDASNNIERMEGVDDLVARVSAGDRTGTFKTMFNEGFFKQRMDFSQFLPPNSVQPGDTWPVKLETPMGSFGTIGMNFNLTFKGWEMVGKRNCARIEMSGDFETKTGAIPGPMGMTITIPEGDVLGVLWFDPEFGTVISSRMNEDITLLMTMTARPGMGAAPPQKITAQLSQVIDSKVDSLE